MEFYTARIFIIIFVWSAYSNYFVHCDETIKYPLQYNDHLSTSSQTSEAISPLKNTSIGQYSRVTQGQSSQISSKHGLQSKHNHEFHGSSDDPMFTEVYPKDNRNYADCSLPNFVSPKISDILSRDMFSQADPIEYLLRKTMELPAGNVRLNTSSVERLLQKKQIRKNCVPYARALISISNAVLKLGKAKEKIENIQKAPPDDFNSYTSLVRDISSFQALSASGLFSDDIFTDAKPPFRFLDKFLRLSDTDTSIVKVQSRILLEKSKFEDYPKLYVQYMTDIDTFLRDNRFINELKQDMAQLQSISTSDNQSQSDEEISDRFQTTISKPEIQQDANAIKTDHTSLDYITQKLSDILSDDMFSHANANQYLFHVMMELQFRDLLEIRAEVNGLLETELLPQHYVPYARALSSTLRARIKLESAAKRGIVEIREELSFLNPPSFYSTVLGMILSLPAVSSSGLFSYYTVSDPNPPIRILYNFLQVEKNNVKELEKEIQTLSFKASHFSLPLHYERYIKDLRNFLRARSILDDLRHDVARLHNKSTTSVD